MQLPQIRDTVHGGLDEVKCDQTRIEREEFESIVTFLY